MARFSVVFGLLVAAATSLVIAEGYQTLTAFRAAVGPEQYELDSSVKSSLFTSCIAAANTVNAEVFNVAIDETHGYTYFSTSDNKTVSWTNVANVGSTVQCAFAADSAGATMFQYSTTGCNITMDAAYDAATAVCESSAVASVYVYYD
ncbi:uncharacterized protein LOC108676831 [Hyalella azteca]|uniref:Uncharacterized protein LOC108676831 n=1 Tax=Hyalella azteca TaxID=294128 RepID=A0A8B7P3D7_HYAAZ|nr:uncharacterized protein LOC108676831 [Hyalella azteca]